MSKKLYRRYLLRSAGAAAISLPLLEAMVPISGKRTLGSGFDSQLPKRLVVMNAGLGFHGPHLFPESPGRLTASTPYLAKISDHLDKLTLISGLSHPEQQGNNGHASELTILTGAQRPGLAGFRNTISLDQLIAQSIGVQTRFPSLVLSTRGDTSLSWTAGGVAIPAMSSPESLFKALFIDGSPTEIELEMSSIRRGRSILDTVAGQAKAYEQHLGQRDRQKLAEYVTSVRELELRLQQSEGWVKRPKPKVNAQQPTDIRDQSQAIERQKMMYELIALALQTDSTRTITLSLGGLNSVPNVPGVKSDWHGLSHHGKDVAKIEELKLIEEAEFAAFNEFLSKLRAVEESDRSLLDSTCVLFGSNLGNASAHDWHNLPIIVAGGGFQHGNYVAHDSRNNTPLANLFLSFAHLMGVELENFGSSTAVGVRGLEA